MKTIKSILSLFLAISIAASIIPNIAVAQEVMDIKESVDEEMQQNGEYGEAWSNCSILKYVDREVFDRKKYVLRIVDEEELNTYVFQTEDGQRDVFFLDENTKFLSKSGRIVEKDLSIVYDKGVFSTKQNDIQVFLSDAIKEGVSLEYDDNIVALFPQSLDVVGEDINNTVVYKEAFGHNTELRYTPTLSGIKEEIVIYDPTDESSYSFKVCTNGLNLFSDSEGMFFAHSEKSETKIRIGKTAVYDSVGHESRGYLKAETIKSGSEYMIYVTADQDFLEDSNTVYPVTVDPSLTVSNATHGSTAIQDAPIFQGRPSENFGDYRYDRLGTAEGNYGVR